jgi:transposase-like protein
VNRPEGETNNILITRPTRGHRRVSAAERARILEELDRSSLTLGDFAAQRGLKYSTLVSWRQAKRRAESLAAEANPGSLATAGQSAKEGLRFTEVCLREQPETLEPARVDARPFPSPFLAPLEVTLRGGAVVRGADMAQLAKLLQLLGN